MIKRVKQLSDGEKIEAAELWIDKKECKHALLFSFFREGYTDDIKLLFDKMEKLDRSISGFAYHYIIGTLYGYRKSSIRGYYLSSYVKTESDWEPFKKSKQYKIYRRDYHKMAKICDEWLEYMMDNSKEFGEYVKKKKGEVELFTL